MDSMVVLCFEKIPNGWCTRLGFTPHTECPGGKNEEEEEDDDDAREYICC